MSTDLILYLSALSLGFVGSLHCVGMCGPLVIGATIISGKSRSHQIKMTLVYHSGRLLGYGILGILFGVVGSFVWMTGLQKWMSVLAGVVLLGLFIASMDIEKIVSKTHLYKKYHQSLMSAMSRKIHSSHLSTKFLLGILNAIIPCGLVYLALVGAIMTPNIFLSFLFMVIFGLGTLPALLLLPLLSGYLQGYWRMRLKRIYPMMMLVMGIILIWRGLAIEMPDQLNFFEAINNPIMCH